MRILHLTAGSDAGGISRYLLDLCTAMHVAGHQVAIAGERGPWHPMFASAPWPWIDAPLKGGILKLLEAGHELRRYIEDNPVDVLHCHYRRTTLVARRIQKKFGTPILYTLHLSHIPLGGPWGWLSDFGDHVHAPSTEGRQWLIDDARIPADRITLIPHGIHIEKYPVPDPGTRREARANLELKEDDLVALFLGRLEDPKNESWLVDLAAMSRETLPNLRVLLAGEGPNESAVRSQIQRQGVGDRVRLLGQRDPLPLLHASDALLLPSAREGFSYACAEAMCAGVPALRTNTSGTAELIVEGTTGRSVAIDHDAFLRAAVKFLSDRSVLRTMGAAAAQHIRAHFTFERQLNATLDLYHQLI
jgi:glycosyltransferase involved in cell wall biosynthesis